MGTASARLPPEVHALTRQRRSRWTPNLTFKGVPVSHPYTNRLRHNARRRCGFRGRVSSSSKIAEQTVNLELSYVLFHMLSRKLDVSWIRHAPKYLCDIYFPKNRKTNSAAEIKWCPISHAIAQIRCVLNFTCAQISLCQILSDFIVRQCIINSRITLNTRLQNMCHIKSLRTNSTLYGIFDKC